MIVLQKFGFKESKYERPQDKWVCGRLADGKPCDLGPGLDGCCRVTSVCQPRLENDRWQCRRSASAGGPCQAGPLPDGQCCLTLERCVPRPSLRAKRKRGTLAAMALMVGVLAVAMGGEGGRHFMMPGKLSSQHAGLTDCSTCHAGARSGQIDLLHRLVTTVEPRQNSNLCVTCHAMGAEPFAPHTHPVEDLKRLTETLRREPGNAPSESPMQWIAFPPTARSASGEVHCATCHKEHQGVFADLKTVSNQRCQTCHVSRFGSFADSHPEFVRFPYQRRPRIIFDHQSHLAKYFLPDNMKRDNPGQVAPDCADCHRGGAEQRYMGVRSFAPMCSGCHDNDITGRLRSGPKGIDVIAVPGLDVDTLTKRGIDIGGWPRDSEADVTPFMRPLLFKLGGEDVVSTVAGLKLLDLREATDQELARVAALAWAVKRLFGTLKTTNPAAAGVLAGNDPKKQMDIQALGALTGGMPRDVILLGSQDWFPNLQDDLQRHDRGEPTSKFKPPAKTMAAPAKPSPPASAPTNTAPTNTPGADILAPAPGAGSKDDILGPSSSDKDTAPGKGDKSAILAPNDSSAILAPNDKDAILAPNKDDALNPDVGNILSSDRGGDAARVGAPKPVDMDTVTCAGKSADAATDAESWAQTGGWYREDCSIRYRPAGHADPFLKTWLDFAGPAYGTDRHDQLAPIFDDLAKRDASNDPIGRCTKCHSVDDQAGAKIVNWQPFDANAINGRFTNYSHKPHIELIGGTKTCLKCHVLQDTDSGFQKSYEEGDPVNYTPNFKHLDKAVCASCHSQQTAWESCTLCHGYHVPNVNSNSPAPALPVSLEQPAVSAATPAAAPPDPEEGVRHEYAMAEEAGTKQAWDEFLANHPSGRYHDKAIEQIARLSSIAAGKPENITPDLSRPATPDEPAAAVPANNSPPATPDKPALTADNPAAPPPETPASPAPTQSASANTNELSDLDGLFLRGLQRAFANDFELAIQDFDEVIRRDPRHAAAFNNRCWSLAMLDEVQAALKDCDASLQVEPNYSDAFDSRGLVNLKLGYYKKAIADYTSALIKDPKRASALYGRGIAKRRSGNAAGAKADIDAAKRIQPTIVKQFAGYGIQ